MSTPKSYSEKLKDPRWQKKRLKILERDKWTCQKCFSEDQTLHVHHLEYIPRADPWDYPDEGLITLCADCHAEIEKLKLCLSSADLVFEPVFAIYQEVSQIIARGQWFELAMVLRYFKNNPKQFMDTLDSARLDAAYVPIGSLFKGDMSIRLTDAERQEIVTRAASAFSTIE